MSTNPPCPDCQTIHCARDVIAVNRFDANAPTRYMPAGGGVTRSTRAEAMADVCAGRMTTTHTTGRHLAEIRGCRGDERNR